MGIIWKGQVCSFPDILPRPRGKQPADNLSPTNCMSYLDEEYIRPICELSGLPGLYYVAGPMVEACKTGVPPHSTGVLAAVTYQSNGSSGLMTLGKCQTCAEEYVIKDVLLHTYSDGMYVNGLTAVIYFIEPL